MSNRTIIEFNHDYADSVRVAAELPALLWRLMASGYRGADKRDLARLQSLGITPLHQQHHTETTILEVSAGHVVRLPKEREGGE